MTSELEQAAEIIQQRAGSAPVEFAAIIGASFNEGVDQLENEISIPYEDLPGFPRTRTFGQENRLVIGELDGSRIALLKGREHYFEQGNPAAMAVPLEVMTLLGAGWVIVTSYCGSVDADHYPGTLALVTDHINFNGVNPLIGAHGDGGIVSLGKAYDERLNARMKRAATVAGITLREGVMMWLSGPSFETAAEAKAARILGAHVLGMSGVSEVILCRRLGLRVCSVSAVSYFGAGFNNSNPTYIEARDVARQSAISLRRLIRAFVRTKEGAFAPEAKPSLLRKPITP